MRNKKQKSYYRLRECTGEIKMVDKNFNPFYDSDFLVSHTDSEDRRSLVELTKDELIQLRDEINVVLQNMVKQ